MDDGRRRPPLAPHEVAIAILQKKWTPQIVLLARSGPRRFSDLYHEIPLISHKVLTQQLRALEKDRLIVRRVGVDGPRQVLYELSDSGRSLLPIIDALEEWGSHHANVTQRTSDENARPHAPRRRSGETQSRLLDSNGPDSALSRHEA
jgi:DNA-binding HxlR family transcriptional regulator